MHIISQCTTKPDRQQEQILFKTLPLAQHNESSGSALLNELHIKSLLLPLLALPVATWASPSAWVSCSILNVCVWWLVCLLAPVITLHAGNELSIKRQVRENGKQGSKKRNGSDPNTLTAGPSSMDQTLFITRENKTN